MNPLLYQEGGGGTFKRGGYQKVKDTAPWAAMDADVTGSLQNAYITDYFLPAHVAKAFKNFNNKTSGGPTVAWYASGMVGNKNPSAVAITLNNFAIKYGPGFLYVGPSGLNNVGQPGGVIRNPFPTLGALAWGIQNGYLVIGPVMAQAIENNAVDNGIVPPSFWMFIGKPILEIVGTIAIIYGGETLAAGSGSSIAGGASASGSSLTSATVPIAGSAPIDTTGLSSGLIPGALAPIGAGAGAGTGGLLASGGGLLASLGDTVGQGLAKTAGGLVAAGLLSGGAGGAGSAGGAGGLPPGSRSPSVRKSPIFTIGILAALGFAAIHFMG